MSLCDRCFHKNVCTNLRDNVYIPDCPNYHRDFELGTSQEQCIKVLKYIRSYCKNHECDECQFYSWCGVIGAGLCPQNWPLYRIKQIGRFMEKSDNG